MSKVQNILFIKINHVQGLSKYISVTNLIGTIWVAAGGDGEFSVEIAKFYIKVLIHRIWEK